MCMRGAGGDQQRLEELIIRRTHARTNTQPHTNARRKWPVIPGKLRRKGPKPAQPFLYVCERGVLCLFLRVRWTTRRRRMGGMEEAWWIRELPIHIYLSIFTAGKRKLDRTEGRRGARVGREEETEGGFGGEGSRPWLHALVTHKTITSAVNSRDSCFFFKSQQDMR